MASYEDLSNSELRKKLLDFGIDLPISINREFLLKKLQSAAQTKSAGKSSSSGVSRRKSSVAPQNQNPSKNNVGSSSSTSTPVPENKSRSRISEARKTATNNDGKSHRYSMYLNYFKESGAGDPSTSQSPLHQSSYSRHSLGPNYSYHPPEQIDNSFLNSADNDNISPSSQSGTPLKAKVGRILGAANPINWIKQIKQSWTPSSTTNATGQEYSNYSYSSSSSSYNTRCPPTPPPSSNLNNGHWSGGASGITPGSRIYSPGRQAGFKAFFSKQTNGVSDRHAQSNVPTSDWGNSPKISKILVAILILFFLGVGVLYLIQIRSHYSATKGLAARESSVDKATVVKPPPKAVVNTKSNYPICGLEGVDNQVCVQKEYVKGSRKLFNLLKDELVQRAKWKGCGAEVEDKLTLHSAKKMLYRLSEMQKTEVDNCFPGILILCHENPSWGLKIELPGVSDEDLTTHQVILSDNFVATITAVDVFPNLVCMLWSGLYMTIIYGLLSILASVMGFLAYKIYNYHIRQKKIEEAELYDYVERIIELLYSRYEQVRETGEDTFLAVSHIRDQLIPIKDRPNKAALWTKVVNYISAHESRVREEIQHISGEEYRVWRWLPSASPLQSRKSLSPPSNASRHSLPVHQTQQQPSPQSLYPNLNDMSMEMGSMSPGSGLNNKWQGQAFEISDGSPNALPITPTTCLKIRQMFDTDANSSEPGQSRIERAILDKCVDSRILHIGVDSMSQEGCVYVKCLTREDARKAYMSLHGWWFDGHLLSVKFLREERYVSRFPESRQNTVPMSPGFYPQQSTSFSSSSSSKLKMSRMSGFYTSKLD